MTTLVIAEIGVNHNADLDMATELIESAKNAGADVAKFQAALPEEVVSERAPKAPYQVNELRPGENQLEMTRRIHLRLDDFKYLRDKCAENGIRMMVSGFGPVSNSMIESLDLGWWKVPSGEITNLPYLRFIGAHCQPVFLSTGLANLHEVGWALSVLEEAGTPLDMITVLQCTSSYPAPIEDCNLNAMVTMRRAFGVSVGYSDHTIGFESALASVALGATVVEKHFTLDRSAEGPDHSASSDPDGFMRMVSAIRKVEVALGSGRKAPAPSELPNLSAVRRSIVARKRIKTGEVISEENIAAKRPGDGISPRDWDLLIGSRAIQDFDYEDPILI